MSVRELKIERINNSEFIAVTMDGSNDSGNVEQELFYVSYLDENYQACVEFIKIANVKERANAQGLKDCFF